jgi:predicted dehydrogenase
MKKLRVGIAGFGFIGPHHLDAIQRTGLGVVTAIATSNESSARRKAEQYGVAKGYGDWRDMVADPDIDVIDVATPTDLHRPIALAAIAAGKHVIVDKPMALTSEEASEMLAAARSAGVVHAITFNIRYNVMLQQARSVIAMEDFGAVRYVHGHYLQEWLLEESDFNWRIQPEYGGELAMVADAGAHWYDLAQHLTGQRIVRVLADLASFIPVRQRPSAAVEAFAASSDGDTTDFEMNVPDLGTLICEFENGARGLFSTSALCAGHKNDLSIEVCGARSSVRWQQERPNELWIGHRDQPNQTLLKDPPLLSPEASPYALLPGGHNEAWPDAFRNLMRNILGFIADGKDPAEADELSFPTFATGLNIARIVDGIAASARSGGQWTTIERD